MIYPVYPLSDVRPGANVPEPKHVPAGPLRVDQQRRALRLAIWVFSILAVCILLFVAIAV